MIEENILFITFFVIKYFKVQFIFYVKTALPPVKGHPLFPGNLPLKFEIMSSPTFLKIWLEVQTPSRKRGAFRKNRRMKYKIGQCQHPFLKYVWSAYRVWKFILANLVLIFRRRLSFEDGCLHKFSCKSKIIRELSQQ